ESVAWIAARKDVLSGIFFAATLLAYARYARSPGATRYLLVVILFACGLMSKPTLVTLPFVLLLLDYWPLNRSHRSEVSGQKRSTGIKLIAEKIPLFALSAASCVVTIWAQRPTISSLGG